MVDKAKGIVANAKEKMQDAVDFLEEDLKSYRAGKASPAILNGILVNYYGADMPIAQVASVTVPDAKTIMIQPWEKSMIAAIEKAILVANIGLTPQNNGEAVRLNFPPLTEDRRRDLIKQAKAAGEGSRVVVRNARRDAIEALKKLQKEGLPEDSEKDFEDQVQKHTDAFNKKIDVLIADKEKDIMTV